MDVIFSVKKINSTIFASFSDLLLVECKNWNKAIGAKEVRIFSTKMQDFNTKIGLIISKMGISGDSNFIRDARGVIKNMWLQNRQVIIVFDLEDLKSVVYGTCNLYKLLEDKYYSVQMMHE